MNRWIHASVFLLAILEATMLSQAEDSLPQPFINSLGSHRIFDGKLTIHILEEEAGIIYKLEQAPRFIDGEHIKGSFVETVWRSKAWIKRGTKWFVFPVSAHEVWIYDGEGELTLYAWDDPKHNFHNYSHSFFVSTTDHSIIEKAPTAVLDRLPSSLKEIFVTTVGPHTFFGKKIKIDIFEVDGMLNYSIARDNKDWVSTTKPTMPSIKKGGNWFICPVTPNEIWIYNGQDKLTLYKHWRSSDEIENDSYGFITCDPDNKIIEQAPKKVRNRLPESMKRKFGVN